MKAKALVILPEAPYPVVGGGPLRSASILEYLAEKFDLEAIHFRLLGDPDPAALYPAGMLTASYTLDLPHHAKQFLPRLRRNLWRGIRGVPPLVDRFGGCDERIAKLLQGKQFHLIWVEHFWAAQYATVLRPHTKKLVLDLHNVESAYFESLRSHSPIVHRPLLAHFARCARALEQDFLPAFDLVVTASEADRNRVAALARATAAIPNTIPWHDLPVQDRSASLVFSGNFAYQPNQQALAWFLANCWPAIRRSKPGCALRLVGKEIRYAQAIAGQTEGIVFVGPVEDAVEEIAKSQIAIVPLLSGSGTRLKILEAWAAGTPVVSTPIGAEGLDAVRGEHLQIATANAAFTQSIVDLLDNRVTGSHLAQAARLRYEARYTWQFARVLLSQLGL